MNAVSPEPQPHPGCPGSPEPESPDLSRVRSEIDELDRSLVELIARRCRLARDAGSAKDRSHLPLVDPRQEAAVVRRSAARARAAGLEEERVRRIFWQLIDLSRESQRHPAPGDGP